MRLVTPGKLNRLLNEERERQESLFDFDKLRRGIKRRLKAFNAKMPERMEKLKAFFGACLGRLWEAMQVLWEKTVILWGKTKVFAAKEWKVLRKKWKKLLAKAKKAYAERMGSRETQLKTKPSDAKKTGSAVARRSASPAVRTVYSDRARRSAYESAPRTAASKNKPKSVYESRDRYGYPERKTSAKKNSRAVKKDFFGGDFAEKHLRSIVSMSGLALALIVLLLWGTCSDGGKRTFASLGMGSAGGYILLGDDCMAEQNYTRAVEHYYTALSKKISYTAAVKLASAYSYAGDINHEVSALLLCVDHYPKNIQPYQQLLLLYPDSANRPERVNKAITQGYGYFGEALNAK